MEINNRITEVIEYSGLTPSEFADKIDVQRSSISHITSGRNKPSLEFIIKIKSAFPDIQWDWLISGEGAMLKELGVIEEGKPSVMLTPEKKMSLPDLFEMIDDDNFGKTIESQTAIPQNSLESNKSDQSSEKLNLSDSQRLVISKENVLKSNEKEIKRIVFFYTDGSFETFEN